MLGALRNENEVWCSAFVFHRLGQRIVDPHHSWCRACFEPGFGTTEVRVSTKKDGTTRRRRIYRATKKLHDFRRTAARNLTRAGIPNKVVMDMIGHKTRSMLDRYNVTGENDLRETAQKADS